MKVSKTRKKYSFPELRGSIDSIVFPVLAEIKYDGEFNYLIVTKSQAYLVNKYGTVKYHFPCLSKISHRLRIDVGFSSATLVCELFWDKGKRGDLYPLLENKTSDLLNIRVHDITEYNEKNITLETLLTRRKLLHELDLKEWLTECRFVENKLQATTWFEETVALGYEGIVLKNVNSRFIGGPCSSVKMKYKDQSNFEVTEVDSVRERIEIVVPHDPLPRMKQPHYVPVGVKAVNKYKKYIKVGDMVTIEHQGVLKSGSLRHPVLIPRKEWI